MRPFSFENSKASSAYDELSSERNERRLGILAIEIKHCWIVDRLCGNHIGRHNGSFRAVAACKSVMSAHDDYLCRERISFTASTSLPCGTFFCASACRCKWSARSLSSFDNSAPSI